MKHLMHSRISTLLLILITFLLFVADVSAQDIYRFYSPLYTSHFYTASDLERSQIVNNDHHWIYEGVFARIPDQANIPLHRFYSDTYRSHFFTASAPERIILQNTDSNWQYEGTAYDVSLQGGTDLEPVFRFWSDRFRSHFYTMSAAERDYLVNHDVNWRYEGVAYYLRPPDTTALLSQDFILPAGNYSNAAFINDPSWSGVLWAQTNNFATITDNEKLRITYPAGGVGTGSSGAQARIDLGGEHRELFFRQDVRFESGFDWQRGGKLPGLSSGGTEWSGGNKPVDGQGFSARYMWRDGGRAIVYLYHADQVTNFGDELNLGFDFETDKTYTLTQRIVANTGDDANGILEVWVSVDGGAHQKVLSRSNIRFGNASYSTDASTIDTLYFSTYHGGSDPSWAPDITSYATFDNMIVTQSRFGDLQ